MKNILFAITATLLTVSGAINYQFYTGGIITPAMQVAAIESDLDRAYNMASGER